MSKAKRIFVIGDFKNESPESIRTERRRWIKGLIRLGHDVQRFSYRNVLLQLSLLKSKSFAKWFVKKRTDAVLAEQVRSYYPDIVLILSMKTLDTKTVALLRQAAPSAVFVGRDNDACPERNLSRIAIARKMDLVVATNAGRFLRTYKEAGAVKCAFIPNVCDPDIQHPYDVEDEWKSDLLFIGKEQRGSCDNDVDRYNLLLRLSRMSNAKMYGCFDRPKINGLDCFFAISGAKVALSINAINDERLYHSDRLVNCLACGTFVLSKRVPDSDLLFRDSVHLRYFDSVDEFFDLADWYLEHDEEREKIAKAGMERAHKEFNCQKMAQYVLDLVDKGSYDAPWGVVI